MTINQHECLKCGYVYDECNCKDKKVRFGNMEKEMPHNKMKRGDICWIEDYQEFGEAIVLLDKRITKDISGMLMSSAIWESYLISSNHKGLMKFYIEDSAYPCHIIDVSEKKLIPLKC